MGQQTAQRAWPDDDLDPHPAVMIHQFLSVPTATPMGRTGRDRGSLTGGDIMSRVPAGFHRVRGHIRRNPKPGRAKRMSGWMIAGIVAGIWLWGQVFGFDKTTTTTPPAQPQPALSSPAGR
ncbi:hypothetical protein OG705_29810 [Streptomyces sp. NBC_00838]|uniref:hypothetical protein n=1 Tax=Streptomyces sp. NBC_00838 TaxID=2903680 RepID=UPI00386DE452|nr:hypothetical protein OG705_29810 [Streptomyces sp. NBC_00838]